MLLIGSAIGAGAVLPLFCLPVGQRRFSYGPAKRLSYDETVGEIRKRIAGSPAKIRPECVSGLLEHGHPTERVFVLMHGLSNCPAQFSKLGRLLFERGHNVLIPRTPYHGEKNRLPPIGLGSRRTTSLTREIGRSIWREAWGTK